MPKTKKTDKQVPTQLYVTRTFGKGEGAKSETAPEQVLAVHQFQTEPAVVRVGLGLTISLGNYETARVDVAITVPCYREEIEDAYVYAKEWVEKRLQAEVDDVRKSAKTASSPF